MNELKTILEIARDIGIIFGIPTLAYLLMRATKAQLDAQKSHIQLLEQTQYPKALETIKAQEELYTRELKNLRDELDAVEKSNASLDSASIEEKIKSLEISLTTLINLKANLTTEIESHAFRRFEDYCKNLENPNTGRPDYVFSSIANGDGFSHAEISVLLNKNIIEMKSGNIHLTKKGEAIWNAVRDLEKKLT